MAFNGNWEQVCRAFACFANLKIYSLGRQVHEQAQHMLNTSLLLVSAHEHQWVSENSPWTPIEYPWMKLSECEHPLWAHEHHWVIIECDSPWGDHEKYLISVRTEWPLNTCEYTWMPLSEYWTCSECLWVCMNIFKWVLNMLWVLVSMHAHQWVNENSPEYALSVHECLWVSIWKIWMRTSRVVNLTNLYGRFKLRVWTLASIKILCYRSEKTCTAFSDHHQDIMYGTSILLLFNSMCKKIVGRLLDCNNMVNWVIYFERFILTLLSFSLQII
jgi:hypothetical protein